MFSISGAIKMFSGKLDAYITSSGGKLKFSIEQIEAWCLKEKVPYKLFLDGKDIVIVKR